MEIKNIGLILKHLKMIHLMWFVLRFHAMNETSIAVPLLGALHRGKYHTALWLIFRIPGYLLSRILLAKYPGMQNINHNAMRASNAQLMLLPFIALCRNLVACDSR